MKPETKNAMKITVMYLDEQMEQSPSRILADTSNYLQELLDKEEQ